MQTKLRLFMENVAARNHIQIVVAKGLFTNTVANNKVLNLPGSTYGFCVRLSEFEKEAVFEEAIDKQTSRLRSANDWHPITNDIYPLYLGKDKM